MNSQVLRESVRLLFHLNGYTKVMVERTEGLGIADGGVTWDLPTERIPPHFRKIGSRFIVQLEQLSDDEQKDPEALHDLKNRFEIFSLESDECTQSNNTLDRSGGSVLLK